MIKSRDFKGREFKSLLDLHLALKANKKILTDAKKSIIKSADIVEFSVNSIAIKAIALDANYIYPVINTTNIYDSHGDVHINGIWNKSVSEQQGKIYYTSDHCLSVDDVIAFPQSVELLVNDIEWKSLGFDYNGTTQALIYKVAKDGIIHDKARVIVEKKLPVKNSVSMEYVNLVMCINSSDPSLIEEKANFDKYFPMVVNKQDVIDNGNYFWAVLEAKIHKEGSMVLEPSNIATPFLYDNGEPSDDTPATEPSYDTQKQNKKINYLFI